MNNAHWTILAFLAAILLTGAGAAQGNSSSAAPSDGMAPDANDGGTADDGNAPAGVPLADWLTPAMEGLPWVLALGGAIGAVAVALPLVGGMFPGTVGATDLKRRQAEIDLLSARYQEYLADSVPNPEADGLANRITAMEEELGRDKLAQFLIGFAFYVFLGTALAAFLGQSFYHALFIGFTGPAVAGQIVAHLETRKVLAVKNRGLADAETVVAGSGASSPSPVPTSMVALPDREADGKKAARTGWWLSRRRAKGERGEPFAIEVLGLQRSPSTSEEDQKRWAAMYRIKIARRV